MSFSFGIGLFACQLLLTYPLVSITHALWTGVKYTTIYIYRWKYPPMIKDVDPKYQVITKKDLSKLDDGTRKKLIDTYGEDIMIISSSAQTE
tara:strand:- start:168 stop:443 length:276 start_codon:yes stop_codon:yes gene_type:complete